MEMLELLETVRAEVASEKRLFGTEGVGMRHMMAKPANYQKRLAEAAKLLADVIKGRRPAYLLQEVMTTSDFPNLFGDVLDRALLAAYSEAPAPWANYCHRATVRDFRTVKRFGVYGADQVLDQVDENEVYPASKIDEDTPVEYAVFKYGRKLPFSWESIINDDLGAFNDIPERFGKASRRSEQKKVCGFYVDANGPHASFYTVGNKNIITGNPVLSIDGLETAFTVLGNMVDQSGEPIAIEAVELVVPPALEVQALNILNAVQLETRIKKSPTAKEEKLMTTNWMKARCRLSVDPYIPIIATTNGNTSWFLFADPDNGRPALELGFLRGHEEPEIFIKSPNAQRVGGGDVDALAGDFDTDSIQYKIRHVFGGNRMDPRMTVGSKGTG